MSSTSSSSSRPYDLVIYGAYGYTGTLTVRYLLSDANRHKSLRWAVAGRSQSKLEKLVTDATAGSQTKKNNNVTINTIVASTDDESSLDAMCKQTKVLLSFAGPYLKCGPPVVRACVRNGTHYMDITGEMRFIRDLVDTVHDDAKGKKVALINSCGFDCVPSDMGSLMMHEHVAAASSTPASDFITAMEGYFTITGDLSPSGGTAATLSNTFLNQTPEDKNPLSINPPQYRSRIPAPIRQWMHWSPILGKYSGPFLMACENERIVRRSNCLLGRPQVAYAEAIAGGFMTVMMELIQFYAINILLPISFFNTIVMLFLPKPGDGPDDKLKQGSRYQATFVAKTNNGVTFKGEWFDNRNAYDTTAVFVTECVACLLEDGAQQFGVVTPASALGVPLLKRLEKHCGIITEVVVVDNASEKAK